MPYYYFNIHNHIETHDDEGLDLPDLAAAKAMAVKAARAMMAENVLTGSLILSHWVDIQDESRTGVAIVRFSEAVKVES